MIPFLQNIRNSLDAIQPGLFNASLAALIFSALWLLRKFKPLFFAKLPPALQAWPALVTGAVLASLSASTVGGFGAAVVSALGQALSGLLSGVLAVGIHTTMKQSPLPYGNSDIPPKRPPGPLVGGVVFLLLLVSGCMGAKSAVVEACTFIDSGNPVVGTLCLTAEEVASLFGHVKASRALRSQNLGAAPGAPVDICAGAQQ